MKAIFSPRFVFWIFSLSVVFGFTLPLLVQEGMFMDALLYTAVSHNLSQGIGTFWFPQFSYHNVAGLPSFHEQPPLVFGLQALFYVVLGDSTYVERLYVFLTLIAAIWLMSVLWRFVWRDYAEYRMLDWLPPVFWIIIPVCFWSYTHNMHENTLTVFTLGAVIIIFKTLEEGQRVWWGLGWGSFFILLAFLAKGLPGLFPLAVPFLHYLAYRKISWQKMLSYTAILLAYLLFFAGILYLYPESRQSLSLYLFERALHRIQQVPTTDYRLYILLRLIQEILPPLLLVVILIGVVLKKKIPWYDATSMRHAFFLSMVGLSASMPLMLTMVQKGFYLVPSFPYFAMSFAIVVARPVYHYVHNLSSSALIRWKYVSGLMGLGVIAATLYGVGQYKRDKELIEDVLEIVKTVPRGEVISISPVRWNEWSLQCYLVRYGNISVEGGWNRSYYLHFKGDADSIPVHYSKIPLLLHNFELYETTGIQKDGIK